MTSPIRIDDDIYQSARLVASIEDRSLSQQVAHWARIGRQLESASNVSPAAITAVLAGGRSYGDLTDLE